MITLWWPTPSMTKDRGSGALETRQIFENQVTIGLIYQRELAGALMRGKADVGSDLQTYGADVLWQFRY